MIIVNCYSNNSIFSQKFCRELELENISIHHYPLSFKIDRFKQISILILSQKEEWKDWEDYCLRIGIAKVNLLYKFVLPIYTNFSSYEQIKDIMGLPLPLHYKSDDVSLVKLILKQKVDLFLSEIQKKLVHTEKFLLAISPKIPWKDQVVLTSKEVSSLIVSPSENNNVLSFGEVMTLQKFWDLSKSDEQDKFYHFFYNNEVHRISKSEVKDDISRKLILYLIFKANDDQQKDKRGFTDYVLHFFDTVYNLAPFPIAIELSERDLIWQNKTFSNLKLLPRNLKKMYDHEKIHTKHGFFIVYKKKFNFLDLEYKLVYLAQQSEKFSNASEDLGIMTSSLAHEMNNPLSAIKAAIEVIGIMDNSLKNKDTLEQMLTSVNRCLQLVKIFLGFTKASYQLDSSKVLASDMIPFRNCWDYAMQLLRTRLVSASLRLQFHWDVKNAFSVGNSNILTMMLYWLLSQFVNIVERKVLISRAKSIDQHIRITEDILAVSIDFDVPVRDIQLMIEQSLLMNHLLELEHLLLFSDQDNQIIIKKANNN